VFHDGMDEIIARRASAGGRRHGARFGIILGRTPRPAYKTRSATTAP
jgi:hypothetical protein